jgi:hypothetical protein
MLMPSEALPSRRLTRGGLLLILLFHFAAPSHAEPVAVRYPEGITHGFLKLRTTDGTLIADGEFTQTPRGNRTVSRMTFRFRDGSSYEETTVFQQQRTFRLISDRVVQRGPSFPQALDMSIDATTGNVVVRYTDKGEQKVESEHLDLPPDVANGLVQVLLKNVRPDALPASFGFVAATPKPRLVKLVPSLGGRDRFSAGRLVRPANHYVLKVDIGGLTGALASIFGKEPPDSHVWVIGGDAPLFVRAEQPFYTGGPLWRIELTSPAWAGARTTASATR